MHGRLCQSQAPLREQLILGVMIGLWQRLGFFPPERRFLGPQELAEKKAELQMREAGVKGLLGPPTSQETRSVEELLSFIEAERGGAGKARNKKKKSKKKLQVRGAGAEQAHEAGQGQGREAPGNIPSLKGFRHTLGCKEGSNCFLCQKSLK